MERGRRRRMRSRVGIMIWLKHKAWMRDAQKMTYVIMA